ncbi:hypothetical protein LCGC14_1014110 [marine sediment metagenome]|uniref:Uncharacterized protein n=1 Tax=marine sediment metagenome TaxID=412755 RepID=A0A0F9QHL3_9ZZZZ
MNKVDELVKRVAKISIWMPEGEMKRTVGTDVAKQILSHPDLALIDRNAKPVVMPSGRLSWKTFYHVIPLAEALKEE